MLYTYVFCFNLHCAKFIHILVCLILQVQEFNTVDWQVITLCLNRSCIDFCCSTPHSYILFPESVLYERRSQINLNTSIPTTNSNYLHSFRILEETWLASMCFFLFFVTFILLFLDISNQLSEGYVTSIIECRIESKND